MNLGARVGMWSGGAKPWVNPYVTDGLIAMWDGEWNAGGGVHDDLCETLVDVAGNINLNKVGNVFVGDNFFETNRGSYDGYFDSEVYHIEYNTIEVVIQSANRTPGIIFLDGDVHGLVWRISNEFQLFPRFKGKPAIYLNPNEEVYGVSASIDKSTSSVISARVNGSDAKIVTGNDDWGGAGRTRLMGRGSTYGFIGRVYTIRLYSKNLSTEEVAANYAIDKARFGLT